MKGARDKSLNGSYVVAPQLVCNNKPVFRKEAFWDWNGKKSIWCDPVGNWRVGNFQDETTMFSVLLVSQPIFSSAALLGKWMEKSKAESQFSLNEEISINYRKMVTMIDLT